MARVLFFLNLRNPMDKWKFELAALVEQSPAFLTRFIKPRLIFLPEWWPTKFNAWAYGPCIFIAPGLKNAPDNVRQYILGHEYGHIYCNHTVLHLTYWLTLFTLIIGEVAHLPLLKGLSLLLLTLITLSICTPSLAKKREFEADAVALSLLGKKVVLSGSVWMANKTGTINNVFRQHRLVKLGWQNSMDSLVKNCYFQLK